MESHAHSATTIIHEIIQRTFFGYKHRGVAAGLAWKGSIIAKPLAAGNTSARLLGYMVRPFLATLGVAGLAAWLFSPAATGATEHAAIVHGTDVSEGVPSVAEVGNLPTSAMPSYKRNKLRRYPQSTTPPRWVTSPPAVGTQREKSSRQRGINPCLVPDPGFGNYNGWDRTTTLGEMIVPKDLQLDEHGEFPLVLHFHGRHAARKEWVQAVDDAVLVGIDLGNNSGPYSNKFADYTEFERLLTSVEMGVALRVGANTAKIGKLGISSWSAGYGAVERALKSPLRDRLDAVILLDGLHTGHADTPRAARMLKPFVEQARRAAQGDTFMYVSHSSILPPSYASTTETANYLIWQVGGAPETAAARDGDPMGLELIREYTDGAFMVRGFSGNGKLDHCAQVGLYRRVLREQLAPRWGLRLSAD
jgi:hypothetical protein